MSAMICRETAVFLLSVGHGAVLSLGYDLLRAVRRAFRHSGFAVSAEDFLFWLAASFLTFCLAFFRTDGIIRGYVAAGMLLGAVLYHFTVSHLVVRGAAAFLLLIRRILFLIRRILRKPLGKIWGIWKKTIEFARKKGYNVYSAKISGRSLRRRPGPKGRNSETAGVRRGKTYGRKKKTAKQEQP